jgi:hypothetical protein
LGTWKKIVNISIHRSYCFNVTFNIFDPLGAYNTFTGNIGVQGAYGAATYDLGAALGAFGPYLNEGGGGGYGGGGNTYGYGGSFFSNKNR